MSLFALGLLVGAIVGFLVGGWHWLKIAA